MKKAIIVLIILFVCPLSNAEDNPAKNRVEFYLEQIVMGNGQKAVDIMVSDNPTLKAKVQQITLLKSQLNTVFEVYGKPFGFEIVSEENLSPSLKRFVYITKHINHPITWEFYMYKPKDKWLLSQVLFVDQFQYIGSKK